MARTEDNSHRNVVSSFLKWQKQIKDFRSPFLENLKMASEILKLCMSKVTSEVSHVFIQPEVFHGG